jgi:hypothetical protein
MHDTYRGYIITTAPAAGGTLLTITAPSGAADAVTVPLDPAAAVLRARRTIEAIQDRREAQCRCRRPAVAVDDYGRLCCPQCYQD